MSDGFMIYHWTGYPWYIHYLSEVRAATCCAGLDYSCATTSCITDMLACLCIHVAKQSASII